MGWFTPKKTSDNELGDYLPDDEADTYVLKTWQVCRPDDGVYEAVVILYYAALNPYLTLKKHMGEHWAQKYLDKQLLVTN